MSKLQDIAERETVCWLLMLYVIHLYVMMPLLQVS